MRRALLIEVLRFLARDSDQQVAWLEKYAQDVQAKGWAPHVQHPLKELTEWILKIPWSADTPDDLLAVLEELDAVTCLMWSADSDFTTNESLREDPIWRVIRRLAQAALEHTSMATRQPPMEFWDVMEAVSD